jgi:hypothetical protein
LKKEGAPERRRPKKAGGDGVAKTNKGIRPEGPIPLFLLPYFRFVMPLTRQILIHRLLFIACNFHNFNIVFHTRL